MKELILFLLGRKTCPQCGGEGTYCTESMARYGDEPMECPNCRGKKWVRA